MQVPSNGKEFGFLHGPEHSRLFAVSFSHLGLRAGRVNAKFGIRNFSEGGVRIAQRFLLGKFEIRNWGAKWFTVKPRMNTNKHEYVTDSQGVDLILHSARRVRIRFFTRSSAFAFIRVYSRFHFPI